MDIYNIPRFRAGETLTAEKLNLFADALSEVRKNIISSTVRPGDGLALNRGPGGAVLTVTRRRGAPRSSGGATLPFAVSFVKEEDSWYAWVHLNGGTFADVNGQFCPLVESAEGKDENIIKRGFTPAGKIAVCIRWLYHVDRSTKTEAMIDLVPYSNPARDLKRFVRPIEGEDGEGESRVVLAVGDVEGTGSSLRVVLRQQLVTTSLRACWAGADDIDSEASSLGKFVAGQDILCYPSVLKST